MCLVQLNLNLHSEYLESVVTDSLSTSSGLWVIQTIEQLAWKVYHGELWNLVSKWRVIGNKNHPMGRLSLEYIL